MEPDPAALARARARTPPQAPVRFLATSAASVPDIPSESVDRVLLSLVLCCMVDKAGALAEAWRILRPGGLLLASWPRAVLPRLGNRARLRVTARGWERLRSERPWLERSVRRGWAVHRHLLLKPLARPAGQA